MSEFGAFILGVFLTFSLWIIFYPSETVELAIQAQKEIELCERNLPRTETCEVFARVKDK